MRDSVSGLIAERAGEVLVMVGDAVGDERQHQRPRIAAALATSFAEVVGVPGVGVERQVRAVLLDRPDRQERGVGGFEAWPWPAAR